MPQALKAGQIIRFYKTGEAFDFLSNVSDVPLTFYINGTKYKLPCAESAYQACKNIDDPIAKRILSGKVVGSEIQKQAQNIVGAKPAFIAQIPIHDRNVSLKEQLMYDICLAKATQNPQIAKRLIEAHRLGCRFVENTQLGQTDPFWGNGPGGDGRNALGKIWEAIAQQLHTEYTAGRIEIRNGLQDGVARDLGYRERNNGLSGRFITAEQIDAVPNITHVTDILSPAGRRFLDFVNDRQPLIDSDGWQVSPRSQLIGAYSANQDQFQAGRAANNQMELDHFYIQWLFPLSSKSPYNRNAPVLSKQDFAILRKYPNVRHAVKEHFALFTKFMGIEQDATTGHFSKVNAPGWNNWINNPHNYLRITRVLNSLVNFGEHELAGQFSRFLNLEAKRTKTQDGFIPFSDDARKALSSHWNAAAKKPAKKPANAPQEERAKTQEEVALEKIKTELKNLQKQLKEKEKQLKEKQKQENKAEVVRGKTLVKSPFEVLDVILNNLETALLGDLNEKGQRVGGLSFINGTQALFSIFRLAKAVVMLVPNVLGKAIEIGKKVDNANSEIDKSSSEAAKSAQQAKSIEQKIIKAQKNVIDLEAKVKTQAATKKPPETPKPGSRAAQVRRTQSAGDLKKTKSFTDLARRDHQQHTR